MRSYHVDYYFRLTTNLILLEESYSDSSESEEISNDEFVLKKFPKENEMNLSQPSTSKNLISCESNSTDTNSEEEIIPTRRCRNRKCSLEKSSSSLEDSLVVKETELLERDGVYTFVKTLIKNLDENVIIPDSGEKKKREKKSVKKLQKQLNKLIIGEILPDSTKETTTNDNTTTILKNKQSNKIKKERNESNDCIKNFPSIIYSRNNSLDETEQQASTSSSPIVEKKTPKKSKKGKNRSFLFTYYYCLINSIIKLVDTHTKVIFFILINNLILDYFVLCFMLLFNQLYFLFAFSHFTIFFLI